MSVGTADAPGRLRRLLLSLCPLPERTNRIGMELLSPMATPTDNSVLPSGFLEAFCRHVVSLSWLDAKIEPDGPVHDTDAYDLKAFSVSAFVISVRHIWFLVTAGHILRDLDERLQAGRRM